MKNLVLIITAVILSLQVSAVEVTFSVDMNEVGFEFTTPEVNGTFNGWCGACAPLSDDDADGVWELVIDLDPGLYEYKFAADNWNVEEALPPGSECTFTSGAFTNRIMTVGAEPMVLPTVCWNSCQACGEGPLTTSVTFRVDMNEVTDAFTTPEVNGIFNDWCGGCAPMIDADADGIWELTIVIQGEAAEYKFAADTWGIQETLTPGDPCTLTTEGFTNRMIILTGGDLILPAVCWGSCIECGTTGVSDELAKVEGSFFPNPASDHIQFMNFDSPIQSVEIFSMQGKRQFSASNLNPGESVDISTIPAGVYVVRVATENGETVQTLVID